MHLVPRPKSGFAIASARGVGRYGSSVVREGRRTGRFVIMASLAAGMFWVAPSAASADSGCPPAPVAPAAPVSSGEPAAAFGDDQPLVLDLGTADRANVLVVNSSTTGTVVRVTLTVTGAAASYALGRV